MGKCGRSPVHRQPLEGFDLSRNHFTVFQVLMDTFTVHAIDFETHVGIIKCLPIVLDLAAAQRPVPSQIGFVRMCQDEPPLLREHLKRVRQPVRQPTRMQVWPWVRRVHILMFDPLFSQGAQGLDPRGARPASRNAAVNRFVGYFG